MADLPEGLNPFQAWAGLIGQPATQRLMGVGLTHGAQTREGERDLDGLFRGLAE